MSEEAAGGRGDGGSGQSPATAEAVAQKIRDSAVRRITGLEPLDGSGKEEVEAFEKSALFFLREYGAAREREALERAAQVAENYPTRNIFDESGSIADAARRQIASAIRALIGEGGGGR